MSAEGRQRSFAARRGIYLLPNLLTTLSLLAGFYSIVSTFNGEPGKAAWAVLVALVLDNLDGRVARMTRSVSRFGVEYDSLADLVSFGVAPAILLFEWGLKPFGKLGWLVAFLFVACAALRLARFNVQVETVERRWFVGLPSPAAAATVVSTVLLYSVFGWEDFSRHVPVLGVVMVTALLMVSTIRYRSFKGPDLLKSRPFGLLVIVVLVLVLLVAEPEITAFSLSALYTVLGPAEAVGGWWRRAVTPSGEARRPLEGTGGP